MTICLGKIRLAKRPTMRTCLPLLLAATLVPAAAAAGSSGGGLHPI